jgi:hypothetical protein
MQGRLIVTKGRGYPVVQVITIRDNESTIILEICQVEREGILPLIRITFSLL